VKDENEFEEGGKREVNYPARGRGWDDTIGD